MKSTAFFACLFTLSFLSGIVVCSVARAADTLPAPALVPAPREIKQLEGHFTLTPKTMIQAGDSPAELQIGRQLADHIARGTAIKLTPATSKVQQSGDGWISISIDPKSSLGAEGYELDVSPRSVTITGGGEAGAFYGVQTLLQLFPPEIFASTPGAKAVDWTAPAVHIKDRPRFGWRGLMMDTSRHFFNKQEVKNFLDLMAQHKLNTFHWHLTDDQGWRIEIKKYPKLTQVGAWRKDIGFGFKRNNGTAYGPDGRYGGFFTQDDVREIVAYAKDRYITIVPEIEMPGHSSAALAAYPEFGCPGATHSTDMPAGVHPGVYCAGNDKTFKFLEDVLDEVIALFPGKYIHIGGDEVPKGNWKHCRLCRARKKSAHLKNEHELQSYFIKRIERHLNSRGRTLIGWDEILEGGLAPNATVMSWRGVNGGIAAAQSGHDVVMTPTSHCYLDYYQGKHGEPRGIGGLVPLQKVYGFDPMARGIPADKAKHVLGSDGNLWSEYFPNYRQVQYMAYPRACAIAEYTWSDARLKNWDDFKRRLQTHFERLKAQGVNYRPTKPGDPGF